MSTSYTHIEGLGPVKIFRRRGLKNIRISITSHGEIRLSIPWYVPKTAGLRYLRSKIDWIKEHKIQTDVSWDDGQSLFADYTLSLHTHNRKNTAAKLEGTVFSIYISSTLSPKDTDKAIKTRVDRFLKTEAEKILVPFTLKMAVEHGFRPKSIRVKNLKSRWGSCNQDKIITLNASLLKLPDKLAEYVIFHELVHTRHLNHSKAFWQEVEALLPDFKERRKALRKFNSAGIF